MGGLSQLELDQLSGGFDGNDDEQFEPSSPIRARRGAAIVCEDDTETMSAALYAVKRRKRISFTGMTTALTTLADEETDLRGGLTQAALDGLMITKDESDVRDDSPISTALRRKKRSRVSVGGAGRENMMVAASEALDDVLPKSPIKHAQKDQSYHNENRPQSPTKKRSPQSQKVETPPRQSNSAAQTPLSPALGF